MTKRKPRISRPFAFRSNPRFVVRSVTGYPIYSRWARKPHTTWYVLDRAFNFSVVGVYTMKQRAKDAAKALNAGREPAPARDPKTGSWRKGWSH